MKEFIDLTKVLKAGDTVNHVLKGKIKIKTIDLDDKYPIVDTDKNSYTKDGKFLESHNFPALYRNKQELLFEYEPEIDFNKVPRDTMVFTGDDKIDMDSPRYFSDFLPSSELPFRVYSSGEKREDAGSVIMFKKCIISPSVEIQDEWLKR